MKETERDKNGEFTSVIGPGDDDGGNQPDERIGVGASIDSLTASVKFRLDPPVQYCAGDRWLPITEARLQC